MKKCSNCYRCVEDWRDAKAKGYPLINSGIFNYSKKPRKGIKRRGIGMSCPDEISDSMAACEYYETRLNHNMKLWIEKTKQSCKWWFRDVVIVPLGKLRKPLPIKWVVRFDSYTNRIIPNGEPECPRCGEMPYSNEQCVFCGQRFSPENNLENPPKR